ncbi:glycosyltransferase family 10 domain-containing protein [Salipiger aestuarii]|uniref:glycosyltransferase family 10 domain-containing protein n=1 Tax=Salipiger aestuarii TaxID=568098 RepID=UPI00123C6E15|nr:glycosyltransferase family 10 [Salipiger aestuarii]
MTPIRIFVTGRHAHRMPLSYPALRPLFEGRVIRVEDPAEADLYVLAHVMDVDQAPRAMIEDWRRRRRPVVVLSEEPFWDTIWGTRPLQREIRVDSRFGALPVVQLIHTTCDIFRFRRIPYYLLTNPRFERAYAAMFARNAARRPEDWSRDWAERRAGITFMFERRPEGYHDVDWPEEDLAGLCAWRTRLAEALPEPLSERLGRSWQGGQSRFDLDDWHADKLARLDGRSRMIGAFENTHQPDYVTEKLFDAFACGALPLYAASPWHRVHELGLPQDSWLNLHDLAPIMAAARILQARPDPEAYAEAQARLAALMGDAALWAEERAALGARVLAALEEVLGG